VQKQLKFMGAITGVFFVIGLSGCGGGGGGGKQSGGGSTSTSSGGSKGGGTTGGGTKGGTTSGGGGTTGSTGSTGGGTTGSTGSTGGGTTGGTGSTGGGTTGSTGSTGGGTTGGTGSTGVGPLSCSSLNNCVTLANSSIQFPDGEGGTVTCQNGNCVDSYNNYNSGYSAGQTSGYTAGQTDGYNSGYTAGNSAGQTSAYNSGYNQGYSDGGSSGYNSGYSAGQSDGYNSGYSDGYNSGYSDGYNSGYSDGYDAGYSDGSSGQSVASHTKDVELQRAKLDQKNLEQKAQNVASTFQMSFDSALQLTKIADQVQQLSTSGKMTDNDRIALTDSALKVAGITPDQVNGAIANIIKNGDSSSVDALVEQAAQNLGMPSSAGLRDKLLPQLGIILPTTTK